MTGRQNGRKVLNSVVTGWFIIAVLGQWIFALYVTSFYGRATAAGHSENWNKVLPNGYVPGDTVGNVVVGIHLLLAVIILVGGPVQLIPKIRAYAPAFHRWNGRIYIYTALTVSLSGLYMVWIRGSIGGLVQHISISINAVLIIISALFTIKYATARNFTVHRIWAIRLFLVVSGVWFFRVGLFFWLTIHQKPVGFDPKIFEGPFLNFLTFAQYVIPLTVFELYLKAKKSTSKTLIYTTALLLIILTIIMGIGTFGAAAAKWIPKMSE